MQIGFEIKWIFEGNSGRMITAKTYGGIFVAHTHSNSQTPLVIPASETAERMAQAAANFLDVLPPTLREKACQPFEGNERFRWHYIPIEMWERQGVSLKDLNAKQQESAFALMESGLSAKGYEKARAIINLESILGEIEKTAGETRLERNPEFYFFTVFGDPTGNGAWGWRAEGTPCFFEFYGGQSRIDFSESFFLWLKSSRSTPRRAKRITGPFC